MGLDYGLHSMHHIVSTFQPPFCLLYYNFIKFKSLNKSTTNLIGSIKNKNTLGCTQCRVWDVGRDLPPSTLITLIAVKSKMISNNLYIIQTRSKFYKVN